MIMKNIVGAMGLVTYGAIYAYLTSTGNLMVALIPGLLAGFAVPAYNRWSNE